MSAINEISAGYRNMIETSNLDWKVQEFVQLMRKASDHSFNEVKAAAIREIGRNEHGKQAFDTAVDNY